MKKASMFIKTKGLLGSLAPNDKLYLGLRAAVLPLAILLPFARFDDGSCRAYDPTITNASSNCMTYTQPSLPWPFVVGLLLVIIVSLLHVSNKSRRAMRQFVLLQLVVSLLIVAITATTYVIMQNYSQVSAVQARSLHPMDTLFGLGIAKETFLLMVAVYLLLPIVRWYKVIFSKNYFLGIKRKDLFQ